MNQWAFVIVAYTAVVIATALLIALSWGAMRRTESKLDELSGQ